MRMALGTRRTDGSIRPPLKYPKNKDIKVARTKFTHFGDLYDNWIYTLKDKNLIWSSVRLTKRQKKPAPSVRSAPKKELLSESDSSDDSNRESNSADSDSSEFDYDIGQKRWQKKKACDKIFNVGKNARKVKTPGTQSYSDGAIRKLWTIVKCKMWKNNVKNEGEEEPR